MLEILTTHYEETKTLH